VKTKRVWSIQVTVWHMYKKPSSTGLYLVNKNVSEQREAVCRLSDQANRVNRYGPRVRL